MIINCGSLATAVPLLGRLRTLDPFLFLVALAVVVVLSFKIWHITKIGQFSQNSWDWYQISPYAIRVKRIIVWQFFWITMLLLTALPLTRYLAEANNCFLISLGCYVATKDINLPSLYMALALFANFALALLIRYTPSFQLPPLATWYSRLPIPARRLIWNATHRSPAYASQSWRTVHDLSQEVHSAGITIALFGDGRSPSIWRHRVRVLWTYLAPVSLPFLCLLVFPPIVQFGDLGDVPKVELALSTIAWAAWSICFFLHFGDRDFVGTAGRAGSNITLLLADVLSYPNRNLRIRAAQYFKNGGYLVFDLIVLALVPVYMGYLDLFK